MFKEITREEYIKFVSNLIKINTPDFRGDENKINCIDKKGNVVAYREKIDGVYRNFVLVKGEDNEN